MSFFNTMREIRATTGLGVAAVRWLLRLPYPLPFLVSPAPKQGGNPTRLYLWADVSPRLRQLHRVTDEQINALLLIAQQRHKNKGLQT
ncbi:MAG: hypothetical protein JWS10_91 [Cypionkella sp.]|uniref:hypothetical protein n=1 Tax=Cypionkella sp. TaxID=2811411 RepID=UPI00262A1F62|nr:hypothetical protein [Cypionkella sp.]MDB5657476.1 hypothetical protein [Cypionkella sp.]